LRGYLWEENVNTYLQGRKISAAQDYERPSVEILHLISLVTLVPREISDAEPFPGSLLSHASALASPGTFIWSRLMDAAMSIADPVAIEIHARVERWALDEMPLPGKLVHQIIEWLYRENRFCGNELKIGEKFVGPSTLSVPTLAVVNTADEVAPLNSLKPFADAMAKNVQIIEYPGELGVCLQHLGILVGRHARAHVWPQILSWLKSQTSRPCAKISDNV
jgi:polyhydroxyalkanoate synthase